MAARQAPQTNRRAQPSYGQRLQAALYHARKRRLERVAAQQVPEEPAP